MQLIAEWSHPDDLRRAITMDHLLRMSSAQDADRLGNGTALLAIGALV
jgi:hypothetical protein